MGSHSDRRSETFFWCACSSLSLICTHVITTGAFKCLGFVCIIYPHTQLRRVKIATDRKLSSAFARLFKRHFLSRKKTFSIQIRCDSARSAPRTQTQYRLIIQKTLTPKKALRRRNENCFSSLLASRFQSADAFLIQLCASFRQANLIEKIHHLKLKSFRFSARLHPASYVV